MGERYKPEFSEIQEEMSVDTIVAPATAPGRGAVAIIRISGPAVSELMGKAFCPSGGIAPQSAPRRLILGRVVARNRDPLDQALAVYFPPHTSPTGESYGEFQIHGSPALIRVVLQQLLGYLGEEGRLARPGEFLMRGLMNGRLDLTQTQGVAAMLAAKTEAAVRSAARVLQGELLAHLRTLRNHLIHLSSIIEAATDFPDEDLPAVDQQLLQDHLTEAQALLHRLLHHAHQNLLHHTGARLALIGPPNAGKSSLFNTLLAQPRAIVSQEPGTTRDTLEAPIDLEGIPLTLIDTAGLHETDSAVERMGIERTHQEIQTADLLVVLHPADQPNADLSPYLAPYPHRPTLHLLSKADLLPEGSSSLGPEGLGISHSISTRTGAGLEKLWRILAATLRGETPGENATQKHDDPPVIYPEEGLLTQQRQWEALRTVQLSLEEFTRQLGLAQPYEILAIHLRDGLAPLDELLGLQASEDVLTALFSQFCIGK